MNTRFLFPDDLFGGEKTNEEFVYNFVKLHVWADQMRLSVKFKNGCESVSGDLQISVCRLSNLTTDENITKYRNFCALWSSTYN